MVTVLLLGCAVNQNVVKENYDVLMQDVVEEVVHIGLECRGSVSEAERHYGKLVMVVVRSECHFLDVLFPHPDLVVACSQVKFGEDARPFNSSISSSMVGMGNRSWIVAAFNDW